MVVRLRRFCAVSFVFCAHAAVQDGAAAESVPEIVVTPTYLATPIGQVGSAVSVINRQQIEAMSPASVAQLFRAIPGVTVANFLRTALNARRRAENPDRGTVVLSSRFAS